ncbi:MAG: CBS domain-containing protein [Anaerolineae bacterium]|jgi:tRNA nucleotidyltransferase (CCA-adding enzyme)
MKIITSHERTDMDALASMYAAWLLYPDHEVILPIKLNRNVRDFCTLYQDELPFVDRERIGRHVITDALLVDTQAISPMRGMSPRTRIQVIDHHELQETAGDVTIILRETVGACTTLLLERIRERGITLSRVGASLMLMGIYEDTGALSFLTTTYRDARAASWLLEAGADLTLLNEFLSRPLTPEQRHVLDRLLATAQMYTVAGRSVCVAALVLDHYVDELSSLIHPLMGMYEPEACLVLAQFEESIQIIARSTTDAIDVGDLLRRFGGGGHDKAAAGRVERVDLTTLERDLLAALAETTTPPVRVRQIMSTNVHTLEADITIRDAAQLMRRYGHEGFPVVSEDERLAGIVTRSDIDRALHHRLGDMPVRTVLYTGPVSVDPDMPVERVQQVMMEHSLGQVPVVQNGRFVGIVTRTDLIKLWTPNRHASRANGIPRLMDEALPAALRELLLTARDVANDLGYALYVVGGFVRDLLLGTPTLDLDLVVEGDAIHMARELAPRLRARVRSHGRFGTAKIILPDDRPQGVPAALDFVTARTEFYERPTVLPTVERSSIKQDLYRRDFTINTMAICLDRGRYGELLDFYGGERDLEQRRIQVLHNLSFVEDPTRILRAVRFEQRLGFEIEERTAKLIDDAIELLDHVTGERLRHELYLLLDEGEPEKGLERLGRMGALAHIHPALHFGRDMAELFVRLRQRFDAWPAPGEAAELTAEQEEHDAPALGLAYLALLTSNMAPAELHTLVTRLHCSTRDARLLREVAALRESLPDLGAQAMLRSTLYHQLKPYSREARFVLSVLTDADLVRARLDLYERELATTAPRVDGHFLRSLGLPPGPIYRAILDRVLVALLDGQIATLEQEEALARALAEQALHPRR